jgi:hypothetical protein
MKPIGVERSGTVEVDDVVMYVRLHVRCMIFRVADSDVILSYNTNKRGETNNLNYVQIQYMREYRAMKNEFR